MGGGGAGGLLQFWVSLTQSISVIYYIWCVQYPINSFFLKTNLSAMKDTEKGRMIKTENAEIKLKH